MAELDAAAELELLGDATGTVGVEHIDESALLGDRITPPSTTNGVKKEDVDLYDDAIAPSGGDKGTDFVTTPARSTPNTTSTNTITASVSYTSEGKKYCCYVGNLTWWTTEADLTLHIAAVGVNDLLELKFFENRINGQSKGYALLIFGSDSAVRQVMEKLPLRPIHGNTLIVLPYTKASLSRLEEMTAKIQTRADPKAPKKEENCVNMGTIRIGANGPGGPTPMMMGRPGPGPVGGPGPTPLIIRPGGPLVMGPGPIGPGGPMNRGPMPLIINGQPPINQGPPMMGRPMGPPGVGPMGPVQSQLPPGAPRPLMSAPGPVPLGAATVMQQGPPPGMQARPPPGMSFSGAPGHSPSGPLGPTPSMMTAPPGIRIAGGPPGSGPQHQMPPLGAHVNPQMFPGMQPPHGAVQGGLSDAEFEEIMNRNRTVSSSAISRAVADASSGDVKSATETILTAISLIKQSRVAHDDRCRMLIASLQDTLSGIESKAFSGSSRSKHRDRSRSRSRERDRKRRRRSRSRSRTRSRSPRHSRSRHY